MVSRQKIHNSFRNILKVGEFDSKNKNWRYDASPLKVRREPRALHFLLVHIMETSPVFLFFSEVFFQHSHFRLFRRFFLQFCCLCRLFAMIQRIPKVVYLKSQKLDQLEKKWQWFHYIALIYLQLHNYLNLSIL